MGIKIECKICGKKMGFINSAHLSTHNMTTTEYKGLYGDKSLVSEGTLLKMRKALEKGRKAMESEDYKPNYRSKAEKEIEEFLVGIGVEKIYANNKKLLKGVELDLVLPNERIAIEYNGLRYHSQNYGKKDHNFHLNKTKLCENEGYRLIHIFEDDYQKNKRIIFTKLANIVGKTPYEKIYGRKVILKEIDGNLKNNFLNKHHIQGGDRAKINIGAYYGEELVSVMTFKPYRPKNAGESDRIWELSRYATHSSYRGVGISSKMLSYFYKSYSPNKVYSFADLSWVDSSDNMYTSLGFTLDKVLRPDYQYVLPHFHGREHKFGFDKRSIAKKFPKVYSIEKTEWEMMQEAGYDRIWDCGKIRYVLGSEFTPPKIKKLPMPKVDTELIDYMERVIDDTDGRLLTEEEIERRKNFYEKNKPKTKTVEEVYVEKDDQNNLSVNKDFNIDSVKPIKNKKSSYSYDTVYSICQKYVYENASLRKLGEEFSISPSAVKRILEKSGVTILSIKRKYVGGKKAVAKRYGEKNKKKLQEKQKAYREENKEKLKDYRKNWYEENKESLLEKKKAEYASKKYGDN